MTELSINENSFEGALLFYYESCGDFRRLGPFFIVTVFLSVIKL